MTRLAILTAVAALLWAPSAAFAQSDIPVTVSGTVGGNSGSSESGVAAGGSVLIDLTDRFAVEAAGDYLGRGDGADAFTLHGSVFVNLLPSTERTVPYAAIGGGMYRATFDLANANFLGPTANQFNAGTTVCAAPGTGVGMGPGAGFGGGQGAGDGTCPNDAAGYWGVGGMNHFYARRLGPLTFPGAGAAWDEVTFTDPVLSIGGGLRFHVNERVMIRPDIRALVVFADGETFTPVVFGLNVGYRF